MAEWIWDQTDWKASIRKKSAECGWDLWLSNLAVVNGFNGDGVNFLREIREEALWRRKKGCFQESNSTTFRLD